MSLPRITPAPTNLAARPWRAASASSAREGSRRRRARRRCTATRRPGHRADAGFTVVETLVAMIVLLVGVLGAAMLMITALEVGRTTRTREAATNLGREIVESARAIRYDQVLTGAAEDALQTLGSLRDADPGTPGWQIERRGVRFTVTVGACVYDDPKDGRAAAAAGSCPPSAAADATAAAPVDLNGDDYRKLSVRVTAGSVGVPLTANVVNPTGGFGPRVRGVVTRPAADGADVVRVETGTDRVEVDVTTTASASLNWDAGDTRHGGQLTSTGAGTLWSFGWSLGSPPAEDADVCDAPVGWTPDAPAYLTTFQPFDRSGLPGDLRTRIVAVDRSLPYRVCDAAGGRNPRFAGAVDLQWRESFEGDVVSYRVSRVTPGGDEVGVCEAARTTECVDRSPLAGDVEYRVRARQEGFAHGTALGPAASVAVAPAPDIAVPGPEAPTGVTVRADASVPRPIVTWTASVSPDVVFYRVYRDGVEIHDRLGRVSSGPDQLSFVDREPGGVPRTYAVSAVHRSFAESAAVPASPVEGGS